MNDILGLVFKICCAFFVSLLGLVPLTSAQTCLPPDSYSLRHFPQGDPNDFNSGIVYYSFDNIPNGTQKDQIVTALNNWNSSLQSTCANVTFVPGPAGEFGSILTFKNGPIPNFGAARAEETVYIGNEIIHGTIIFNPNLTFGTILFYDPNVAGYNTVFTKQTTHEIGHLMGMTHYTSGYEACTQQIRGSSVMNDACGVNDNGTWLNGTYYTGNNQSTTVKPCDSARLPIIYPCILPTPTPEPTPLPTPIPWCTDPTFCGDDYEYCLCTEFAGYWDPFFCECWYYSPILIDVNGDGFRLSAAANGVAFDLTADGVPEQLGWTRPGTDDGWLVLDRNNNGVIDDGTELFGNYSPQPEPPPGVAKNGFLALAEYDKPENGGNSDGVISRRDQIFSRLRIWQDVNHNGYSEPHELRDLEDIGLRKISLDYDETNRVDQHGNRFKFRARVLGAQDAQLGRWAWDVYLVSQGLSGVNPLMRNVEIYSLARPKCGVKAVNTL